MNDVTPENCHYVEWIFFDVGGVLLDDSNYESARIDNLHHTIHIFDSRISRQQIVEALPKASAMSGQLNDNILAMFINDSQKLHMARNLMAGKRQAMYEDRGEIRPNTFEVLTKLSQGYKIGLIANQPKTTRELLIATGLDKLINHFKVSDDHGLSKPDVRYFKAVLNECGATADKSIIVDDNIERGLLPAKRIGMTTVWFKNAERLDPPTGSIDYTIHDLSELLTIFK